MIDKQIKSKKRVKELAEVYTNEREVNSMLDLIPIKSAEEQLSYTYLEPACGNGNFLIKILERKLNSIKNQKNYNDTLKQYELLVLKAVSTIYAIDICPENVFESKERLFNGIKSYLDLTRNKEDMSEYFIKSINYILNKNIVVGNFIDENNQINFNDIGKEEMKFNVIIGNPPYHLSDGGGGTGKPIYQNFINKSISVSPKYLIMIVPSRWMAGGEVVLDKFREQMLNDKRLRSIYDFKDAQVCFPSVGFGGGVNYFLWDRDYNGSCEYTFKDENGESKTNLNLSKYKILVRKIDSLDLLNKILNKDSNFFGRKTIGSVKTFVDEKVSKTHFRSNFKDFKIEKDDINNIELYGKKADGARNDKMVGYVNKSQITKNIEEICKYKVLTQKTSDDVNVLSEPFLAEPNSVWTETNFQIGWGMNYNKEECLNLIKYLKTKFVRFLISLAKISHNMSFKVFIFVPILDMKIEWTAKMLYERYDLTDSEIKHIEASIK